MSRVSRIKLKTGEIALVDLADAHLVREYKWYRGGTKNRYAVSHADGSQGNAPIYLHRLLMGAGHGDVVDHINGEPLDCRKANMRFVTMSQNSANRTNTKNPSGYRGAFYFPLKRKYKARITCDGGVFSGPYRATAKQAAHDWDSLARALFGEFATYNFPRQGERGVKKI